MTKKKGLTDTAAMEDQFKISSYIDALTDFIRNCKTPMTISIQGSWGTGKTTVMRIVKNALESGVSEKDKIKTAWFNTWQYSQFHMDDMLAISLLKCLLKACDPEEQYSSECNKVINGLWNAMHTGIVLGRELPLGFLGPLSGVAAKVLDFAEEETKKKLQSKETDDQMDPIRAVEALRAQFEAIVQKSLAQEHAERFVIFIDDLDRLEPKKAVELLEVLKLFLDSKNCVFVLAIDYDVVVRGVQAKYGAEEDNNFMEENGRKFFDKIIQVPFDMPTAKYEIDEFLESNLKNIMEDGSVIDPDDLNLYKSLIQKSIGINGTNPRGIKRLLNTFQLLSYAELSNNRSRAELSSDQKSRQNLLFASLCLQLAHESLYQAVAQAAGNSDAKVENSAEELMDYLEKFAKGEEQDFNGIRAAAMRPFLENFLDILHEKESREEQLKLLQSIMTAASMTSSSDSRRQEQDSDSAGTDSFQEEHILKDGEWKYGFIAMGAARHIGFDQKLTIKYSNGGTYETHTHRSIKGRIDGLKKLFRENNLEAGDRLHLIYDSAGTLLVSKGIPGIGA